MQQLGFLYNFVSEILKLVLIQLTVRPFCASSHRNNRERPRLRRQYFTEARRF